MIDVEGLSVIDAVNALRSAGFEVGSGQIEEASEEIEEGKVIRTEPVSGSLVPAGTQVMLVVSTGLPTVVVPAVTQVFADTAIQSLRNSLLEPIVQYEQVPAGSANVGRVIAQEPEAFVEVEVGSEVLITVGEAAPETTTTTTVVTPSTAPPEG
jgi:serine/threonine-protein kinase